MSQEALLHMNLFLARANLGLDFVKFTFVLGIFILGSDGALKSSVCFMR